MQHIQSISYAFENRPTHNSRVAPKSKRVFFCRTERAAAAAEQKKQTTTKQKFEAARTGTEKGENCRGREGDTTTAECTRYAKPDTHGVTCCGLFRLLINYG